MLKFTKQENVHLLQLPSIEYLKKPLQIKGKSKESTCVLCTEDETFALKQVMSSNSLLVAQQNCDDLEIVAQQSKYIECLKSIPQTETLTELLVPYAGPENEKAIVSNAAIVLRSTKELERMVMASTNEIHTALDNLCAFELDSKWRILEINYKKYLVDSIIANIAAEDLNMNRLDSRKIHELLNEDDNDPDSIETFEVPFAAVEACLCSISSSHDGIYYKIDPKRIARFLALFLFETKNSLWILSDFMESWNVLVPEFVDLDVSLLKGKHVIDIIGLALIEESTLDGMSVRYFPLSIPMRVARGDVRKRFDVLFAIRRKWSQEDIIPYIMDLVFPKALSEDELVFRTLESSQVKELDGILIKYARLSKADGKVFYTNRFPIAKDVLSYIDGVY